MLKERLILKCGIRIAVCEKRVDAGLKLSCNCVIGLRKCLFGRRIREEVGSGVEVDALGQPTRPSPNPAHFQNHIRRELPLDGEVESMTAADFDIRIVLETEKFTE